MYYVNESPHNYRKTYLYVCVTSFSCSSSCLCVVCVVWTSTSPVAGRWSAGALRSRSSPPTNQMVAQQAKPRPMPPHLDSVCKRDRQVFSLYSSFSQTMDLNPNCIVGTVCPYQWWKVTFYYSYMLDWRLRFLTFWCADEDFVIQ